MFLQVAPCLGCVHELESDSVELRELAQLAAQLLEEELNMTQVTEVTQVYRAAYQVGLGRQAAARRLGTRRWRDGIGFRFPHYVSATWKASKYVYREQSER